MFSRILAALLVVAISSPVGVLAQVDTTGFIDFAESITAVESLIQIASRNMTNVPGDFANPFQCLALTTANTVAVVAVTVAKGKGACPAASIACTVANVACTAAGCTGCPTCPSC